MNVCSGEENLGQRSVGHSRREGKATEVNRMLGMGEKRWGGGGGGGEIKKDTER